MHVMRLAGAISVAFATAFLIAVQLVPFGGVHQSPAGVSIKADAYVWEAKFEATFQGESQSDSRSWFDDDFDEENGSGKVRTGAIFLVVGLAFFALGAVLQFVMRGPFGPLAALAGFALTLTGMIVFAVGVGDLFDHEQDWLVGFYFTIVAMVVGLAGAVLGLLPENLLPTFKSKGGPSF